MKTTLKIDGMSCEHCVTHVKDALEEVAGVGSAANTAGEARAQHRVNKRAVISNLGACMESSDYSRLSLKVDALPYVKKGRLKRARSLQGAGRAA